MSHLANVKSYRHRCIICREEWACLIWQAWYRSTATKGAHARTQETGRGRRP